MSTRKKEGISSVREKTSKGSSSPSLSPSHLKSKPSKTKVSTSRSLDSSPSEKPIPNYLKPTLSSSKDATKILPRKPVSNTDSAVKSSVSRRRSFDKPPSPTRTLKARGVSPTATVRSSSFSGKIGAGKSTTTTMTSPTSPKGDRSSRGKQHSPLYSRSVSTLKKIVSSGKSKSKKGETGIGSSSRKEAKRDNCNVVDASDQESSSIAEPEQVHKEHDEDEEEAVVMGNQEIDVSNEEIHGVIDEVVATSDEQVEEEVHKADSPTVLDDHNHDDDGKVESPTTVEDREANVEKAETHEICEENVSEVESPTLSEQDKVESPAPSEKQEAINEEGEADADAAMDESLEDLESPKVESQHEGGASPAASDKSCIEEISIQEHETKEKHADEVETSDTDDGRVGDDPNGETEEEAKADDSKEDGAENGVEARANDEEEKNGAVEEDENTAPKEAHGKKDVALSNNVIEEMTREQRRNKVRALAGAFETVMQRQEPK